ncbi:MAG: flagellar basal body rod protein FlgC [Pedosphaera sp.]|nr:flagellar basal body rod protein FlgC [Pedosphaera sp.]
MLSLLPGIQSSMAALNAERMRLDIVGQNISNANISKGLDGKPYQRQQVIFESVLRDQERTLGGISGEGPQMVRVARVEKDSTPPRMIYNPSHPQADKRTGFVALPDINVHGEMVDLMAAGRAFEANLAVIKTSRTLAMQSLQIGKR